MELTPILPLVGTIVGAVLATLPHRLTTWENRNRKRADLQEQTIRELQEALAALLPLCHHAAASRKTYETKIEPENLKLQLSKAKNRSATSTEYMAGKRRAEILTVRIEDSMTRQFSSELIDLAEARFRSMDDSKNYEFQVSLGEKFTRANERLGEVLRSLH